MLRGHFASVLDRNGFPGPSHSDHRRSVHEAITEGMGHVATDAVSSPTALLQIGWLRRSNDWKNKTAVREMLRTFRVAGLRKNDSPMCCMSLHVKSLLASRASAQIPAANGAEADVPVWLDVQEWWRSVVITWRRLKVV